MNTKHLFDNRKEVKARLLTNGEYRVVCAAVHQGRVDAYSFTGLGQSHAAQLLANAYKKGYLERHEEFTAKGKLKYAYTPVAELTLTCDDGTEHY